MPFDASVVTEVRLHPLPGQGTLHVAWSTTAPDGTWFQVYGNGRLRWHGRQTFCDLPWPAQPLDIAVGAVEPSEAQADLSAALDPAPGSGNAVEVSWLGGLYLDPGRADDVAGFRVYGESTPGGGVDLATPLADVPVSPLAGFGRGPFGRGGFGRAAARHSWTSPALAPGTWAFRVRAYDAAGDESTVGAASATVSGPPGPPAPFADGKRLHYSIDPATRVVILSWNPPA